MKPQVLFIGDLNKSLPQYDEFTKKFDCIEYELTTLEQLIEDFKTKFQNVQAIYGAWLGFFLLGGFRNEVLQNSPSSLKVISICSVGHDGYDGKEMAEKNIILTNVPSDGASEPVAELVLYNALLSFRNFKIFQDNFSKDTNNTVQIRRQLETASFKSDSGTTTLGEKKNYAFGHYAINRSNLSPRNHNVIIVGFGKIGQTIGKRLAEIGMNIHYTKRSKLSQEEEAQVPYPVTYHKTLTDTRDIADLIVVACPGTPETKHMINKESIDAFAKPIRIINIGRGTVIDEQALVDGLKSGKVVFAGLDVFEDEPRVHEELFGRQDVVLTPHIAASTVENFDHTAIMAMKNIENVLLENGNGINKVN
ncbi:DEHA2B04642p [Debaryomyces hansenii CBS767]|jgi:gluconate 2-dehydrogenase|uniref:DEHA2B04642p n=1 Tax=Debaryomyces hansenii (strain ATCC 36239 / CBS 767 / BCRC 21394 / JCM 1990 / NBRC 0083 / IGC 2968) TaxID=284592 RepID=Q6BXA5_DEBHA|nr:DEHA2B04642p [Debaryomyces hansenii CBS767]CAG85158.1 DEHA2B04642p [Debaryomyces hansenii CBS767]|eukprot:XP_457164.1 DEHA2B04642p [Debaryomyces hansenii CBS767]